MLILSRAYSVTSIGSPSSKLYITHACSLASRNSWKGPTRAPVPPTAATEEAGSAGTGPACGGVRIGAAMLSTAEGAETAALSPVVASLSPVFAVFSTAGGEGSATAGGGDGGSGRRSVRRVTQARTTPTRRTAPAARVPVARRLPRPP